MADVTSKRRFPRTWITYVASVAAATVFALSNAGLPPGTRLGGVAFLFFLIVVLAVAANLANAPDHFRRHGYRGLLPLLLSLGAVPVGGTSGAWLFKLRFRLFERDYERVAQGVYAGTYQLPLNASDASLGYWGNAIEIGGRPVAVHFLTVTFGYAGHRGYLRVFDDDIQQQMNLGACPPGGWRGARPLGGGWYSVSE